MKEVTDIIDAVEFAFNLKPKSIISKNREVIVAYARMVAVKMIKDETGLSFSEMGRLMKRHHSSIMHNYYMKEKKSWDKQRDIIKEYLENPQIKKMEQKIIKLEEENQNLHKKIEEKAADANLIKKLLANEERKKQRRLAKEKDINPKPQKKQVNFDIGDKITYYNIFSKKEFESKIIEKNDKTIRLQDNKRFFISSGEDIYGTLKLKSIEKM